MEHSITVVEIAERLEEIAQNLTIEPMSPYWAIMELINDIADNTYVTEG
jgi:hypothetical protein